jgi:capsular exopolysaccharide synthesis family protein
VLTAGRRHEPGSPYPGYNRAPLAGVGEDASDPRIHLRQIWRYRWVLLGVALLIPALVYVVSALLPKTYEATATLEASSSSEAARGVQLVETDDVARKAARELGGTDTPEDLERKVSAGSTGDAAGPGQEQEGSQLFEVTASADDGQDAAAIANAFADSYVAARRSEIEDEIQDTLASLGLARGEPAGDLNIDSLPPADQIPGAEQFEKQQGKLLAQELQKLQNLQRDALSRAAIIERAEPPDGPSSPRPLVNTAVAAVFSLLLAGGLAVVLSAFDRRLQGGDQLEELLDVPLLATIPEAAFATQPPPPSSKEAFHALRANLTYLNPERPLESLIVVSPGEAEGGTTVAVNLAVAFAEADHDVVLIDADLRRPGVSDRLGAAEAPYGLEDVAIHGKDLDTALVDVDVDAETGRLRVLSGGAPPANAPALLSSDSVRALLKAIRERADLVVIDAPPLLAVSDAVPLLAQTSGAVLVARSGHTGRRAVVRARSLVEGARGTLLGAVATGIRPGPFEATDYTSGYGGRDGAGTPSAGAGDGNSSGFLGRLRSLFGAGQE